MKTSKKFSSALAFLTALLFGFAVVLTVMTEFTNTFADNEEAVVKYLATSDHFVIFYDEGNKLIVRTNATTVAEAIDRAGIVLNTNDSVEPALDTQINADNFYINIYRSYPVFLVDGATKQYTMTSEREPKRIFETAGFTIYDGDEINRATNTNFLESGLAIAYEVKRNGGETITVEEEIPFAESSYNDTRLSLGSSRIVQYGEVGRKITVYQVKYINGEEAIREIVSEQIVKAPKDRVIAKGTKTTNVQTTTSENVIITWNFLKEQGFTDVQVAGIMGNLEQEHRFKTSDAGSAVGLGIAQWMGSRRTKLLSRPNPYNIYTQLNFLMEELNTTHRSAKTAILAATTIEAATRAFQNKFERCGVCREDTRIQYAYAFYNRFHQ